jgi:putative endonuclease
VGACADLEKRIGEHQAGAYDGYTAERRPVVLAYSQYFDRITDAIAAERQVKGWSRVKKEALIAGDFEKLKFAAQRRQPFKSRPKTEPVASSFEMPRKGAAPQDEH